jgi:estrogen-related receptor ERR
VTLPHKLIFASDFVMDEMQAVQCKAEEMFTILLQLSRRLATLRLAKEEFLVLKALLLTNVDIPLEDSASVFKLRESLLSALHDCVSLRPFSAGNHLGQILLCLPLIRQTDAAIRRFWSGVRKDGKVQMNKLFIEMLESTVGVR